MPQLAPSWEMHWGQRILRVVGDVVAEGGGMKLKMSENVGLEEVYR